MTRFVVIVEFVRGRERDLASRDSRYDFSEVEVLAGSEFEANLVALQMVAGRDAVTVTRTIPSL